MADETVVQQFAEAIAYAEGFYSPGSRPQRNNNPGDLTLDIAGGGVAVGNDGPFMVYQTAADGWADLYAQVRMALDNTSHIYNRDMTILEFAQQYTTTQQMEWAQNVASRLGVSLDTRLSDLATPVAVGGGAIVLIIGLIWFMKRKGG